jgi:prepilin-type N-terminal cleavage/methylation domain-containing protein
MSDKWNRLRRRAANSARAQHDEGMTLPEVLIAIAITGLVASTLAMVTTVILRQTDNTNGRTNNARSEQNINQWMPTDLSSAESVDKLPGSKPCGAPLPACPTNAELRGSNALMLTWHGRVYDNGSNSMVDSLTVVSYRVVQETSGEFRLYRVQCTSINNAAMTCTSLVVLRNLNPPPADVTWVPGTTPASWVMTVTDALLADDTHGAGDAVTAPDPSYKNKGAQRLVVTINGGGDAAGAGGGQDQISLSAGGTNREIGLTVDSLDGTPNFSAARSRCGGNFGMVVDHSLSITASDLTSIKNGINNFIDTFAGTPIKLQVVTFGDTADTLGAVAPVWGKYYDMLVDSDVSALKGLVNGIPRDGWTNWEDGLMRMLRNIDGTIQAQLPGTLIFFTDGVPTKSRIEGTSVTGAPVVVDPLDGGLTHLTNGDFDQISWNRAERIVRDRGAINLIGVFVNANATASSTWTISPSGYNYEVGNTVVYQQSSATYERNASVIYQVGSSNMKYEKLVSGNWVSAATPSSNTSSAARSAYLGANTTTDSSDGWRVTRLGAPSGWTNITVAQYNASNTASGNGDGFQTAVSGSLSSTWNATTAALYNLSNTTTDSTDGWRTTTTWNTITQAAYFAGNVNNGTADGFRTTTSGSSSTWAPVTAAQYNASNTTSDSTDGWRATFYAAQTLPIKDYATIGNLIVGNTSGVEGGFVEALPRGGPYLDAAAADLFVLPNYTNFSNALASVALDQCGGTVTLQTKVGATGALDPFTYQNATSLETVQTSAAFRSGTFDVALPGGASEVVTITPQDFTNLTSYVPAGWSCKSAGVAYPFTTAAVPGHAPWTSITLTVSPNKAVSCVQQVTHT